jgi:hypothetical protein
MRAVDVRVKFVQRPTLDFYSRKHSFKFYVILDIYIKSSSDYKYLIS